MTRTTNWAGNVTFGAARVHRPTSLAELRSLIAARPRVGVLGTGHSFSPVADTTGDLLRLDRMPRTTVVDTGRRTVTVSSATTFGELGPHLHRAGLALRNLGSLPHISVAGACATGTHGSGPGNPALAADVVALELVTADGGLLTVDEDAEDLPGAVVALGALGVVTRVTLRLVPAFDIEQYVHEHLPLDVLEEHFDRITGRAYSVSVFTDWRAHTQVWTKRRCGDPLSPLDWAGAVPADGSRHPVAGHPAANCTAQLGRRGPSHELLPHFRSDFTPSTGDELQSEYFVRREDSRAALRAVRSLADRMPPVLQVSEIRTVAADHLWLSPAWQRPSTALHFTWIRDPQAVAPVVRAVEEALAPFDARPHWGKIFSTEPDALARTYGRMKDFLRLRDRLDPDGTFANDFTNRYLAGP
ncbi:D-arabinono-1,4-lactone oxidase [Streptomyces puniciscabiei]